MHKIIFAILTFILISSLSVAQRVSVLNGVLNFSTVTDYETIVEASEPDKDNFYQSLKTLSGFTSLSQYPKNGSLPDSIMEDANFVSNVLNREGVVKIGGFFYKINFSNQKVYVLPESLYATYYNDLINSIPGDNVGEFDMDFDIIDMVESGILTQPSDEELSTESARIRICWKGARAKSHRDKSAMYFRDLSDPASTFGACVNYYDGTAVASTRLKCKIEYRSLGIWCRLDVDAKIQKPSGKININDIPLWTTCRYNVGEQKWTASFKAVFRGRCSDDVEQIYNPQNLNHPVSDENKGRKVLWERIRGLPYYCVQLIEATVNTNNAFLGPGSDAAFCASNSNILYSPSQRTMSTFEFNLPNPWFLQRYSNTVCQ